MVNVAAIAASLGRSVAQADWLGPKVGGHLALMLYLSNEPGELSQWQCHADSTINIVVHYYYYEQPLLTSIIQKRRLMLFGHLIRMDESADARRILTAILQIDWRRPVGRPHSYWMATLRNDLSLHNLTYEGAIEMALDKPLLAASGATH